MSNQAVGNNYYGRKAEKYFPTRSKSALWNNEQSAVESFLTEVPDGSNVLDIPFGTGRFVDLYLAKDIRVYGLDISEDMINASKQVLGNSFYQCRITIGDATEKLPYQNNFFDVIVCLRFIKFFPYKTVKKILKEFHRLSKSKIIIGMKYRRESEPPVAPPEQLKAIGGHLCESDIFDLFKETSFKADKKIVVNLNNKTDSSQAGVPEHAIYLLKKRLL